MATPQKIRCRVSRIIDHGSHVYTIDLVPERPVPRFRPGQFLHLALDAYDPSGFWPDSRVFSIASPPGQRDALRLSYSVRGRFTARMEEELAEGRDVWIKLPYGEFIIDGATDVVLLAGGTGITAFTGFLENLAPDHQGAVYLVYGVRTTALLFCKDMIDRQAQAIPALHVLYFVEPGSPTQPIEPVEPTQPVKLLEPTQQTPFLLPGSLSLSPLWPLIANPGGVTYSLSGPPAMLTSLSIDLRARGISPGPSKAAPGNELFCDNHSNQFNGLLTPTNFPEVIS